VLFGACAELVEVSSMATLDFFLIFSYCKLILKSKINFQMQKGPIKVFISYSHETKQHNDGVLALANRLCKDGIECEIDQYQSSPEKGWQTWMEDQIEESKYVLIICTETYLKRFRKKEEEGTGKGVTWEGAIITAELYNSQGKNEKFIPIVFSGTSFNFIPSILQSATAYRLNDENDYEKLYRRLTDQHKTPRPKIGEKKKLKPELPVESFKSNTLFNVPIHQNRFFTGREDMLKQLKENLESSKQTELTQQALSGLGGVGKTQIAAEYAHRYRKDYQAVLWVEAETDASLSNSVVDIASLLDLPEKDQPEREFVQQAVQRWLTSNSSWLLILDNVEEINLFKNFVPPGAQGHVIITTRLPSTGNIKRLDVKEMEDDGVLFLLRRSGAIEEKQKREDAKPEDLEPATEIKKQFGGLALALEQAGAYIEGNGISLARYLELYKASGSELLKEKAEEGDYKYSVARAFDMSLQKTKENSPTAYELIQLCAFYDPDSIPELIFKKGREHLGEDLKEVVGDDLQWERTVKEACRFSLLERNWGEESFRMHRLIQKAIRESQKNPKEPVIKAIKALSVAFPNPQFHEIWDICLNLLLSVQSIQEWIEKLNIEIIEGAHLDSLVALYFHKVQADYEKAELHYLDALKIKKKLLGDGHYDVAVLMELIGEFYRNQRRYVDAELFCKESLKVFKKLYGNEHLNVAFSFNNIGLVLFYQYRIKEAEEFFQKSLNIWKLNRENDDLNFASLLNNFGMLYENKERYEEASEFYLDSLEIYIKLEIGPNPDVAQLLSNIASLHEKQRKFEKAESFYLDSLKMKKKLYREDHPNIAVTLNNLGSLLLSQNCYEKAEMYLKESFEAYKKNPQSPDIANCLNNLGMLNAKTGNYMKAENYLSESYELFSERLGNEHQETKVVLNNLKDVRKKLNEG
jgi:tetratricopeptide (TPR) repeat protein